MDFVWILFAFGCGLLVKMVRLPSLIGYLCAGFILHYIGMEPIASLETLASLGISLMLFSIGVKLKITDLMKREVWASTFSHMALWVIACLLLAFFISLLLSPSALGLTKSTAAIIAFSLSFSSTVCIFKLLEDNGELTTRHGRVAIGILVMQDIIAVVYLVIASGNIPSPWAFTLIGLWWLRPLLDRLLHQAGHSELLPLAGFMLAIGGYELFQMVGLKGDLGALVLGVLVSASSKATELTKSLNSFKDLFLIGFFLTVGFTALPDWNMLWTAFLLALLIPLKFALFFGLFALLRLRIRTTFLSAMLLSNFSEFGLIVMALSVQLGLIEQRWLVILAVAISISFLITSLIYRNAHHSFSQWKASIQRFESKLRLKEDVYLQPKNAEILVVGMGRVGRGAYHGLNQLVGERVWGMDANRDRVKMQRRQGLNVFTGDGEDPDIWDNFDLSKIHLILLATPSISDCHNITAQLRDAKYSGKIAAITRYQDEKEHLLHGGIDKVFNFFTEAGTGFAEESLLLIERREFD